MARASLALLSILALTGPALAQDLGADLSQDGLDFVAQELPGLLPDSFTFSGFTNQLINCPFTDSDTDLKVTGVKVELQLGSMAIKASGGNLSASLVASGSGSADLAVTRPYACVGSTLNCKVSFSVTSASASASMKPVVSGGQLKIPSASASVGLTKSNVSIKLSSCGLASKLANLAMPLFEGYIVGKVRDKIEEVAKQEIPKQVERSLASFTRFSGQAVGFKIDAALSLVDVAGPGVHASATVGIEPTSQPECNLAPAAPVGSAGSLPAPGFSGEHLAVTVAGATLQRALRAAWQGGLLCLSSDKLTQLGVPPKTGALVGALIGLGQVDSLGVLVPSAPVAALVPGSDPRIKLTLPQVQILLQGPQNTVTIDTQVDVDAALKLDAESRAVKLELKQVTVSGVKLSATDPKGLSLSPTLVKGMIESAVVPMLTAQLADLELLPTVLHHTGGVFDPYYLSMPRSKTSATHVTVWGKVFRTPASDTGEPETKLESKPGPVIKPRKYRFVATGSDNKTPTDLLRFQWRVDGGEWTGAAFARFHALQLAAGQHTVETRSVDLNGNTDASPAKASFTVDGTAPTLAVGTAPSGTIQAGETTIDWTASDDVTPAQSVEVNLVAKHTAPGAGQETLFVESGFTAGAVQQQLVGLTNGTYTVTLVARDQAGNLSKPSKISFTVEDQAEGIPEPQPGPAEAPDLSVEGGCSVAHGQAPAAPAGLLILMLLALCRRRPG